MKHLTLTLLMLALVPAGALAGDEGHRQAALEITRLLSSPQAFASTFQESFQRQLEQMAQRGVPQSKLDRIKKAGEDFVARIIADPERERRVTELYVQTFTEKELRELLSFYATPAGKKVLEAMPGVTLEITQVGRELAQKYIPDYQAQVRAIVQEGLAPPEGQAP